MEINWSKYKSSPPTRKINKMLIPVNNINFSDEGIAEFNAIYCYFDKLEKDGLYQRFVETRSGGISVKLENIRGFRWLHKIGKTFHEIIVKHPETARLYRFMIGYAKTNGEQKDITGRTAFIHLKKELEKDNVNLDDYSIENGEEVKKTFPKIKIKCLGVPGRTYGNCHHIDLNSSFAAGMMEFLPALKPTITRIYEGRKIDPLNKAVLNMSYGFMQSSLVGYRFAHISKAGVDRNNKVLDELSLKLNQNGYRILGYNTDGIWYQSVENPEPYHDEGEGSLIGQWKNDHTHCTLRYKSDGCYEFIEDNKYYPVFRGTSSYEKIKPKEEWVWGDIFNGATINYVFVNGEGFKSC